jgi:hypothetical protein
MKKTLAALLVLLLIGLVSLSTIHPAQADINSVTWIKPAWKGITDNFLGDVSVAYVEGSTWTLNIRVDNYELNSTWHHMDARVYRIAVWFDWNKFYNTTLDVTVKYSENYLFTISGTTEQTSIASNLFTHSYKVYAEFEDVKNATEKRTWGPTSGDQFAVLSQEQYDSPLARENFWNSYYRVSSYVNAYAESLSLRVQAEKESDMADMYYEHGEFSSAVEHYNTASNLLDQSFTAYTSRKSEYDDLNLNSTKADLDKKLAETEAIKANATATETLASATATATLISSFGFVFFGLGFIIFGVAAMMYARRKPA